MLPSTATDHHLPKGEVMEANPNPLADWKRISLNTDRRAELYRYAGTTLRLPTQEAALETARADLFDAIRTGLDAIITPEDAAILRKFGLLTRFGGVRLPNGWAPPRNAVALESRPEKQLATTAHCLCPPIPGADDGSCYIPDYSDTPAAGAVNTAYTLWAPTAWTVGVLRRESAGTEAALCPWIVGPRGGIAIYSPENWTANAFCSVIEDPARRFGEATIAYRVARRAWMSTFWTLVQQSRTLQDVAAVWPEAARLASQFGGVRKPTPATADELAAKLRTIGAPASVID
jgi:hypothetical protein